MGDSSFANFVRRRPAAPSVEDWLEDPVHRIVASSGSGGDGGGYQRDPLDGQETRIERQKVSYRKVFRDTIP